MAFSIHFIISHGGGVLKNNNKKGRIKKKTNSTHMIQQQRKCTCANICHDRKKYVCVSVDEKPVNRKNLKKGIKKTERMCG